MLTLFLTPLLAFIPQGQTAAAPHVDMARAKRVFENSCAGCHGPAGLGGRGPNLTLPKLRHANSDPELAGVILGGIPGTEMPPSWYLGEEGVTQVITYIHQLRANATPPRIDGDVANGKAMFDRKGGCSNCHTIGGRGHAYGPELGDIGARRTEVSLRQSLEEPNAEIAENFLLVRAVTREGTIISGIRVNEDSFTIQISEPSGRVQSLRKADLTKLEKLPAESPMPSYKAAFSAKEMQDLIAYLSSLRGEQ
jgi:cytochrome c oxidase cbb3-type subunit 3